MVVPEPVTLCGVFRLALARRGEAGERLFESVDAVGW
jgi:hypothetical protein